MITRSIGHAHIDGSLGLFKECVLCCSVAVHLLILGANNKIVTKFFFLKCKMFGNCAFYLSGPLLRL